MKTRQLTFILFVLISLFVYSSCSKNGNDNPFDNTRNGSLTAKIDGERFESVLALGEILDEGDFRISGDTSEDALDGETIAINFFFNEESIIEEGDYETGDFDCFVDLTICPSIGYVKSLELVYDTAISDGKGNITISSIDFKVGGTVQGTFSGTLIHPTNGDTVILTDGQFNVTIQ